MTIFLALIVCATAGAEPDDSGLEEAFRRGGAAGFLLAVRELEREQGPEHTAKTLAEELGRVGKSWEELGRVGKSWEELGSGKSWGQSALSH